MKNLYRVLQSGFILLMIVISCINPLGLIAQTSNDVRIDQSDESNLSTQRNAVVKFKIGSETSSILTSFNMILDLPQGATLQYNGEGVYQINNMPDAHGHYNIKLRTGGNILNGVSSVDISLIQRHILGNGALANEYKLIAADVNCDGRISVKDLVDLRKAILEKIDKFACNTNFTFYPGSLDFDWTGSDIDLGVFIPIKLGDVNGSASYNGEN
jgi:hypothetical protein